MENNQPPRSSPPILAYYTRELPRPFLPLKDLVRILAAAQVLALFACVLWALLEVGPVLPNTMAFDPTPLLGNTMVAVAALSNEHPFPVEHIEEVSSLLRACGGTILNGPNSKPAPAPERLETRHFYPSDSGVTWIELSKGWIKVGQGMIAYWPNTRGWYLLSVYDSAAALQPMYDHHYWVHYTNLPAGFGRAVTASMGGGRYSSLNRSTAFQWQSPLELRVLIVAIAAWGLWVNLIFVYLGSSPRRDLQMTIWAMAMLVVALLAAHFVRPSAEFFVLPSRGPLSWFHWQPFVLVPCAIGVLVFLPCCWRILQTVARRVRIEG